jgi:hypothetical protein
MLRRILIGLLAILSATSLKIYLVPSLDLVVVLTGGNYNAQSPATAIMAKELVPALLSGR